MQMLYNLGGLQHQTMILIFTLNFEKFDENDFFSGLSYFQQKWNWHGHGGEK